MIDKEKTLLIFATELEAEPFIKNMGMVLQEADLPETHSSPGLDLIITGIGKANAAMSTALALYRKNYGRIINLGAAGALKEDMDMGDIFTVKKIVEPGRPSLKDGGLRISFPEKFEPLPAKTLATRDRMVVSKDERLALGKIADIVDMEGAAILQACRKFGKSCSMIKFISDRLSDNENDLIRKGITELRSEFYKKVNEYMNLP